MSQNGPGEYPVIVFVDSRYVRSGVEETVKQGEEVVAVAKFETQPALVRRGYGLTINQGNYESARVDISVTVPCYVEDLEAADEFARRFVEERIEKEVASVRGAVVQKPEKKGGGGHW